MKGEEREAGGRSLWVDGSGLPRELNQASAFSCLETPTLMFTMGNSPKRMAQTLGECCVPQQGDMALGWFPGLPESWISWCPGVGRIPREASEYQSKAWGGMDADNRVN